MLIDNHYDLNTVFPTIAYLIIICTTFWEVWRLTCKGLELNQYRSNAIEDEAYDILQDYLDLRTKTHHGSKLLADLLPQVKRLNLE